MRTLPATAVFTYREATQAGWSSSALKHAVATGRIVRLRAGLYAHQLPVSHVDLAGALAGSADDIVISHRSAALVHGLPLLGAAPADVSVTVPPRSGARRTGMRVHRATLRPADVQVVGRARVTRPAHTAVDVARNGDLCAGLVVLDAVVQRRMASFDEVDDVLRHCWNWPGIGRAQAARRHADGVAESPLESVSRLAVARLGLPAPTPQTVICDMAGRFVGRCDFYWDEFGVVGEADGRPNTTTDPRSLPRRTVRRLSRTWAWSSSVGAGITRCVVRSSFARSWRTRSSADDCAIDQVFLDRGR